VLIATAGLPPSQVVRSNHESDFSGLRRLPLRATNAIKELPLTDWVMEMGAIYFDINPEMGLQAQQDWQTLVYLDLYTTTSFFPLPQPLFPCGCSSGYVGTTVLLLFSKGGLCFHARSSRLPLLLYVSQPLRFGSPV
jgi:hypothetical protein